ncbi:MAG: hypothetical protein AAF211_01780, partial [Myxococcota bacterium]
AVGLESGIGRSRMVGRLGDAPYELLAFREGPDVTTAVVASPDQGRALVIDGFRASAEPEHDIAGSTTTYMAWMGHLPMMLHDDPTRALVICFGTGQTADAVRKEGPDSLTIVDINPAVFEMAHLFRHNRGVLDDPRTHLRVMDGRAWMRRTDERYDVITLEPMPPFFAGVNALYSREFYEAAHDRLTDAGTVAQWLPFHLVTDAHSRAIVGAFLDVFPNSLLWVEPVGKTGILVGRKDARPIASAWPGLDRAVVRPDPGLAPREGVVLTSEGLATYAAGHVVTDDNQILAYGAKDALFSRSGLLSSNLASVRAVAAATPD